MPSISNVLAVLIWFSGMYVWWNHPYEGVFREERIAIALTIFMLFVVRSDLADEAFKGLSFYSKLFGFLGLSIVFYVVYSNLS